MTGSSFSGLGAAFPATAFFGPRISSGDPYLINVLEDPFGQLKNYISDQTSQKRNSILNFGGMDQSFGKNERLKSKILISQLFAEGKSMNKYPLRLVYLLVNRTDFSNHKTAVSVPKRRFKKAVDRMYLKRLMREAFRKNKYLVTSNMEETYAFMFIYTGREKAAYHEVFSATEVLLKRFVEKELK